jgi:hypothetical protein
MHSVRWASKRSWLAHHALIPLPSPPSSPRWAGKLITWTKGFTCEGVVGEDPVRLLSEALERAGRPCRVGAGAAAAAVLLLLLLLLL